MRFNKLLTIMMMVLLFSGGFRAWGQVVSPSGFHYVLTCYKTPLKESCLKENHEKGIFLADRCGPVQYLTAYKDEIIFNHQVCTPDSIKRNFQIIYIHPELFQISTSQTRNVVLRFAKTEQPIAVLEYFKRTHPEAEFAHGKFLIQLQVNQNDLQTLAGLPWVISIEPALGEPIPLDRPGTTLHRTQYIGNNFSGLPNLHGKGIVAGIGDGGFVAAHKDFDNRLINTNLGVVSGFGNHGDHNSGLLIGAGKLSTSGEGMATEARLFTAQLYTILDSTPSFYNNYGMIATNNSYGYSSACNMFGIYNSYSAYVDAQLREFPKVLHFFAAGNSGASSCSSYPTGFGTLEGYFGIAKNGVMVGNVDVSDNINSASSKGPAFDGRIKPDIVGYGTNVFSTVPTNAYASKTGTSHGTPGVMGAGLLIYERFKQLHQDSLPDGELVKSLMMLAADDLGNAGPDFTYGYGRVNARKAIEVLESNQFYYNQLNQNDSHVYTISVPTGCSQLRVMLGWRDVEGNTLSLQSLTNNLDLKLYNGSGILTLPWILDTTMANVNSPATRGIDNINNHELVTIDNPTAGNYIIKVIGKNITSGPQDYYIVYQFVKPKLKLTYPVGNEKLISGLNETIRWDADGITTGTYSLSYSSDSGTTWNLLSSTLSAGTRNFTWTVPNIISGTCLVRIIHSGGLYADTSFQKFTITPQPAVTVSTCDKQLRMNWSKVPGADSYEVMMLDTNNNWMVVANTTDTLYTINYLKNGVAYFVSVRIRKNNLTGDLGNAVSGTPSAVVCGLTTDAALYELVLPATNGRKNTSTAYIATQQIRVTIKNLGSNSITGGIPLSYSINGGTTVTQSTTGNLNSNASTSLTFTTTANLSAVGTYKIKIWSGLASDQNRQNDTVVFTLQQLPNDTVSLPYTETFENINDLVLNYNNTGISGANRFDYVNTGITGRLRTAAGPGFYSNGSRSITLDRNSNSSATVKNLLTLTVNLSHRDTANGVNFFYDIKHHGEEQHATDSIWVRGNDVAAWIKVRSTFAGLTAGIYNTIGPIKLDSVLKANGQNFSSSTQIRFGQEDDSAARMQHIQDGISIDNIKIIDASNDVAVYALVAPTTDCSLSASQTVQINISNLGNASMTNVPVYYSINGGSVSSGMISSISGNSSVNYTFPNTFDASQVGIYTIKVWSGVSLDQNRLNDTIVLSIRNLGWVTSFPYIEDFESNNGNYYINSGAVWQWGSPAKSTIDTAANGTKCWVTRLSGNYPNGSLSQLYSGCFDFSSLTADPVLSFNRRNLLEQNYDFAYVEYSENGSLWNRLGTLGQGTGWYNSSTNKWTGNDTFWQVSSLPIPLTSLTNKNKVRFRWVFTSDNATNDEGIAIDDINIYAAPNMIYTGTGQISATSTGAGWVDFNIGGNRVASVKDNGQTLGNVSCSVYKNSGGIRYKSGQPYLNRSWVIKPANQPTAPCLVRLYITKSELDSLISEDPKAFSFQEFGMTKWSGAVEDSSWLNNSSSGTYILPSGVAFKPFNGGYFAEFLVSSFSEFYMNSGGPGGNAPLPIRILDFKGEMVSNDAQLSWSFINDEAIPDAALEWMHPDQQFRTIYNFEPIKSPVMQVGNYTHVGVFANHDNNFYRLRIGSQYSDIIYLQKAGSPQDIKVFPNPGNDFVMLQGSSMSYTLYDLTGKLLISGTGHQIDVRHLPSGIYILKYENSDHSIQVRRIEVVH